MNGAGRIGESARRALEVRRVAAVEAGAAKQLAQRDARAAAREEAMAARGAASSGGVGRPAAGAAGARAGGSVEDQGGGGQGSGRGAAAVAGQADDRRARAEARAAAAAARGAAAGEESRKGAGGGGSGLAGGSRGAVDDDAGRQGVRSRPEKLDVVLDENEKAYASHTEVGGMWLGGLFAKRDLVPGEIIAKYEGVVLTSEEADASTSEYLMTAVDVRDRRKRVVFDGHPQFNNLAGFANYAAQRVANAVFEDQGRIARQRCASDRTDVVLKAWVRVPSGQEIRVDYDMGASGRPFRRQMLARGVEAGELDGPGYRERRWAYPGGGGGGAPAIEGGGRGGEAASGSLAGRKRGECAAGTAELGREGGGKRAPRRAGGRAATETLGEGRKRDAQTAGVPPPRDEGERKSSLRSAIGGPRE